MTLAIALLAALGLNTAVAQVAPVDGQFPAWAEAAWKKLASADDLQLSTRLNPFVWRGDFDGDGKQDLAVLVQHGKSRKEGIAFLLRGKAPQVIGAGRAFGNGGDDFSWMDVWHVVDRGTGHGNPQGQSANLKTDGLLVAKESSASALIYFRNGKPRWQQYGD